jgi:hypothetical protein
VHEGNLRKWWPETSPLLIELGESSMCCATRPPKSELLLMLDRSLIWKLTVARYLPTELERGMGLPLGVVSLDPETSYEARSPRVALQSAHSGGSSGGELRALAAGTDRREVIASLLQLRSSFPLPFPRWPGPWSCS